MSKYKAYPKFMQSAQDVLRQMLEEGQTSGQMPQPFHDFQVVIGGEHESSAGHVEIPLDLKEKVKETVYIIDPKFA